MTSREFSDRIRFNWGYWDGRNTSPAPWHRDPRFDGVYDAGYLAGARDREVGGKSETSDHAWKFWTSEQRDAALRRKTIRELRPSTGNVVC